MKKIFLVFILALSMFGAVGFAFADDGIDRDKVPYNPVAESLWSQSRTDPGLIPPAIKVKKDEILNEWCLRSFLSGMALESARKELTNSIASIVLEETFYKILRYGDFSVPSEEMAENLKNKAIVAMNTAVSGGVKVAPEILAINAIKGIVATDDYGKAFMPGEYNDFLSFVSDSCGIGALLKKHENGVEIISVQVGGAEKAGLKKGDVIMEVNGIVLRGFDMYKILSLLKGAINTKVMLGVIRGGIELRPVEVVRSPVKSVSSGKYGCTGYIKLMLFSDEVGRDFESVLIGLLGGGIDSLVIDLRGNPGGSVEETIKVLGCFVGKGTLFCLRSGDYIDKVYVSSGKPLFHGPIMVLVAGNSASSSEIVAGVLKGHGAKIIGEKTFGKGTIQRLFAFPENNIISAIKFTIGRYEIFSPLEKKYLPVDKIGIEPDIKIDPTMPIEKILDILEVKECLSK